jgi:hypothetical protein
MKILSSMNQATLFPHSNQLSIRNKGHHKQYHITIIVQNNFSYERNFPWPAVQKYGRVS